MFPHHVQCYNREEKSKQLIAAFDIVDNFCMYRMDEKQQTDEERKPHSLRFEPFSHQVEEQHYGKRIQQNIDKMTGPCMLPEQLNFNGERRDRHWPVRIAGTVVIEESPRFEDFRDALEALLGQFVRSVGVEFIVERVLVKNPIPEYHENKAKQQNM